MHGHHQEEEEERQDMLTAPSGCPRSVVVFDPNASHLSHFSKDGRKINLGDCALFKAEHAPPLIGILRKLIVDKDGNLKLVVNWLYRPANVKLSKGSLLEAAPNEIFYSFHRDEIPAISLLHPCKVAFLPKGVELPQDISSFLCRRVYDIANKRLWWLTDRYCTDEKQEEVNRLLDRTRQEMQASVPSPQQPKGTLESAQNGSISSQSKGKKRERAEQQSGQSKREKSTKSEDSEMCHSKQEQSMGGAGIWEIANRGGALVSVSGVNHLVDLMRKEKRDHHKRVDADGGGNAISRRSLLAGVIAATDREDCLGRFVQLGGLRTLDNWLQEAHKFKTNEGGEEGLEELLLTLLRALEKLPIDLGALKSCNVGKSVNNLRSHKNLRLQRKARKLVDTWKKRVEEEIKLSTTDLSKVASTSTISASGKAIPSRLANDSSVVKLRGKGSPLDETFSSQTLAVAPSKEHNNSNNRVKDERSTSSSHSQNNSQSFSSGTPVAVKVKVSTAVRSQTSSGRGKSPRIRSGEEITTPTKVENSSNRRLILRLPNPGRGLACISAIPNTPISEKHDSEGKTGGIIHSPVGSTNTAKLEACSNNHKGSLLNHVSRQEVGKRKKSTPAVLIDDAHTEVRTLAQQTDTDGGGINLLASVAVSENSEEEKSAGGNKGVDRELDRESMNDNDKEGEKNAHVEGRERGEAKSPNKDAKCVGGEGIEVAMVIESLPEEAKTEQSCVESQQQIPDVDEKCTDALATHDKVEEADNGISCIDPPDGSICQGENQENENACMDDNGESADNEERGAAEASINGDEEGSIEVLAMELEHALEVESELDGDVEVVEGEKEVPSIVEVDEAAITQQSATLTESNDDMGRSEGHGRPLFDLNEGIFDEPLLLPSVCHPTTESELERKDSVATSAFRPVLTPEKKPSESGCDGLDGRQSRVLDIDLNIADKNLLEEGAMMPLLPSQDSGCSLNSSFTLAAASSSSSRPVLDLNMTAKQGEESPEGLLYVSKARGNLVVMRDFDLNNGPLFEEEATESIEPLHLTKANNVGAHALLPGLVGAGAVKCNRMDSEAKNPTPSWPSSFHVLNKPLALERSGLSPISGDVCEASSSATFSCSPLSHSSSVPTGSTSVHEASIIRAPTWLRPSFDLNIGPLDGERREEAMMNGGAALKRRAESKSGFDPFRPAFHG